MIQTLTVSNVTADTATLTAIWYDNETASGPAYGSTVALVIVRGNVTGIVPNATVVTLNDQHGLATYATIHGATYTIYGQDGKIVSGSVANGHITSKLLDLTATGTVDREGPYTALYLLLSGNDFFVEYSRTVDVIFDTGSGSGSGGSGSGSESGSGTGSGSGTAVSYTDTPADPGTYYYRAAITDGTTEYLTNAANATLEATPPETDPTPATDATPPTITLLGDAAITLTVGQNWVDPGATATDDVDQSVTVTTDGTVDTSTPGTYLITYLATDTAGNEAIPVTREVTVVAADSGSGSEGSGSGSGSETDSGSGTESGSGSGSDTGSGSGSGSDTGSETGSGSGAESGSGSGSDTGSGSDSGPPSGAITYTTPADAIEPNQRVWLRAVLTDGDTRTSTNADSAYLTQPTVLRAIYDNNVLCLWRSGMTLSSSSDNCFRARLETGSGSAARVLRPTEITSIVYSIRRLGYQASQSGTAVTGHTSIVITTCPWVLQNPITDTNWNVDTIGYNFMHWPNSSEYFPFGSPGFYEIEYIFTTTNGQRLMLVFKVNVS